ncbi:MAG: hypothetical protein KF784_13140 [Fimbriimonadaceae bacterium]|nr:hypothetical protein [Fimbriimonadaceae bacterium]
MDENGQAVQSNITLPWSQWLGSSATNGTPYVQTVSIHSQGTIKVKYKWRGSGTVPGTLRLKVASAGYIGTNGFSTLAATAPDSWNLDTGLGLAVEDGSHLYSWHKYTPGHVLRKVKIDENGEGELVVDQAASLERIAIGTFTLSAGAPSLQCEIDNRDVMLTTQVFGTPLKKKTFDWLNDWQIVLPQDDYTYYSGSEHDLYWRNRVFSFFPSIPEVTPLYFPSDSTDYMEWHVGLKQDDRVVNSFIDTQIVLYEILSCVGLVGPYYVGDSYDWTWSLGYPMEYPDDYPSAGTYDGTNIDQITHRGRRFTRPSFYIQYPGTSQAKLSQYPGHAKDSTLVKFKWTWGSDGLVGESIRNVFFHRNAEPDGQVSSQWYDLKVGESYLTPPGMSFEPPSNGIPVTGWITAGAADCDFSDVELGKIKFDTFDSGVQALVALFFVVSVIEPTPFVEAITAFLVNGTLSGLSVGWDDAEPAVNLRRTDANTGQCDTLIVRPAINVPGYGAISEADYSDPQKLSALKDALMDGNLGIYYWKLDYRRIYNFHKYMVDNWGHGGYVFQTSDTKSTPLGFGSAYYKFTFDTRQGGGA